MTFRCVLRTGLGKRGRRKGLAQIYQYEIPVKLFSYFWFKQTAKKCKKILGAFMFKPLHIQIVTRKEV